MKLTVVLDTVRTQNSTADNSYNQHVFDEEVSVEVVDGVLCVMDAENNYIAQYNKWLFWRIY